MLLSFIFSGRNSIMFIVLVRHLGLSENDVLILYADPIFTVRFSAVREKQSPLIYLQAEAMWTKPSPLLVFLLGIFDISCFGWSLRSWLLILTWNRWEIFSVLWKRWFWSRWIDTCLPPGADWWPSVAQTLLQLSHLISVRQDLPEAWAVLD